MYRTLLKIYFLFIFILFSPVNSFSQNNAEIDSLSGQSLYLELFYNSQNLYRATGFVIEKGDMPYLITNLHVVSGIDFYKGATIDSLGRIPNKIVIYHHLNELGTWTPRTEELYDITGNKRWIEHPNGKEFDIIALPLLSIDNKVKIYSFDVNLANTDMIPEVAMPVSIIGYPAGIKGIGNFPIWKTGHIASEPTLNYDGKPYFLIDATTRGGMSGSPVILRLKGGYRQRTGGRIMSSTNYNTLFLGVYSAQSEPLEIGIVWKPIVIQEILNNINNQ